MYWVEQRGPRWHSGVLRYKSEGRWFDSRWCHWSFSLTYSSRSHYGAGVDSASNRNEYRCVWLTTLPPPCAVVMKSGNLNFLEPCGPLQACNVTDLPLGDRGGTVVKVLYYKSEGRWFDSRRCRWNFSLT